MTNRLFVFLALLSIVFIGCPAPDEEGDNHGFQGTVYFTHDNEIRKIDLQTTVITTIGEGHSPSLMSNGELLACLSGVGLVKYTSNGGIRTTIVSSSEEISDPQFSPAESRIAYSAMCKTYIVTAAGEMIDSIANAVRPEWITDSKIILQIDHKLYAYDLANRSLSFIADMGDGRDAAISPDRSRIAFVDGKDLFTMNIDGSNKKIIMSGHAELRFPAWSRNGNYVVLKDGCDLKLFKVSGGMVQSFKGHFFLFTDDQCPDASQLDWH